MVEYTSSVHDLTAEQLTGFFAGWPNPPTPQTFLRLLQSSDRVLLARERPTGRVVGFITAITDHVLFAYIPLLEVLPEYQGRGIGQELVRRMLDELDGLYHIDLACDPDLQPFYARLGMRPCVGMMKIDFARQSGE